MATLQIFRETSLPATVQPYSIYFIAPAAKPNYVEIYVTDATGANTRRIHTKADIQAMVNVAVSGATNILVLADIGARNALNPTTSLYVYVRDASADTTVNSGGATYLYDIPNTTWIKVSESESMDLVLSWTSIKGKPSSTVTQIDSAVAASHTHANKTNLDAIGEDTENNLTFNGKRPTIAWTSIGW